MTKKAALILCTVICTIIVFTTNVEAAYSTYIVQKGDSMWKIAVRYQIGLDEIIRANPQVKNPDLIYPNQKITIPTIATTKNVENQVVMLVNTERKKAGLKPLTVDWELQRVARFKSCDMAENNYFSHQSPTYGSPFEMMRNFGIHFHSAGENIAAGQRSAQEVMKSWMNSQGHRANILNAGFTSIGVGYCTGGRLGTYWTQQFISK